jgi:hypothetical protein
MSDTWEYDDWETTELPDLEISIKNKERELKLLEERKLVEDADLVLAEELFSEKQQHVDLALLEPVKICKQPVTKQEKQKKQEAIKRQKEITEIQKAQSQKKREQKQKEKRHKELYGEAEADEYEEKYGYIEDQY